MLPMEVIRAGDPYLWFGTDRLAPAVVVETPTLGSAVAVRTTPSGPGHQKRRRHGCDGRLGTSAAKLSLMASLPPRPI